ncbi:hypothetical protein [Pectobacterium polaris]|uniref:hypothetical protein n=1 Tax=Pectobacterium polaris TaxID=2042057 RepID=UPI0024074691|nr:hypothetical protein [Pectobacterium polaris]MDG0800218.1 hypothetical protein [Pectobacterium polaris]
MAEQLAAKLDAREHILNHNSFTLDNMVHIVELIDNAAAGNGHYGSACGNRSCHWGRMS